MFSRAVKIPRRLRINIDIEDWLWEHARKYAEQKRFSLSYVANVALRDYFRLKRPIEPKRPGRPRRPPGERKAKP